MIDDSLQVRTADGEAAIWRVEHALVVPDSDTPWRLSLADARGGRFDATGVDLYDCLKQIRRQVEQNGILLCCNGARRNATPSGYLSSTLGSVSVYRVYRWRAGMPWDLVDLFGYAPPRRIATVAEQEAHLQKVYRHKESALSVLNPLLWITFGLGVLLDWWYDARSRRRVTSLALSRESGCIADHESESASDLER